MSELYRPKHDQSREREHAPTSPEEQKNHLERLRNKVEAAAEKDKEKQRELREKRPELEKTVGDTALTTEQLEQQIAPEEPEKARTVNLKEERTVSFDRTMVRVRKKLNATERPLSKVIHNPVVEKVSEAAGKTVARPSGLLGGAVFAFIGTSALLWITNHYGYEYSYLVFMMLFVGGFIFALMIEGLWNIYKRKKHPQ